MIRQIRILTKAQICNFGGLNVMRFSKDKKKRANTIYVGLVWLLLGCMMCFYMGSIAAGYIKLGLGEVVPMYLSAIAALIIFFFGMFKAGSVIFQKNAYEGLCAMPVSDTAIVVSRFLSMYLSNLLLSLLVMLPGMVVYGYMLKPGIIFYLVGIVGTLFVPLLPMTVATLLGALVTAVAARVKHKSLVSTVLTLVFVGAIMLFSRELVKIEETEITEEMMIHLSEIVGGIIGKLYPSAVWLGRAMVTGSVVNACLYFGLSIAVFLVMVALVAANFKRIYTGLYSVTAKHNFKLKNMQKSSVLSTLYKREWKRYLSCSIYVTNTIIGPIMMVALSIALFFVGTEQFEAMLEKEMIIGLVPFVLSGSACLATTTCVSVSMEGKEWWIIKSLPVSAKALFDSKILMNLSLMAPFYVIAEVITLLALRPTVMEVIWLIVLPALFILFSGVFGLTANLWFPVFEWENEVKVVKQSASMFVGGFGGSILMFLFALSLFIAPVYMWDLIRLVIAVVICAVTIILYRKNNKIKLTSLG